MATISPIAPVRLTPGKPYPKPDTKKKKPSKVSTPKIDEDSD